mmetsp:Transcript_56482/g.134888  ORF Transcript_56482/g.134888 Transcript_56482/m.134888 type:complete len:325 (+) Transcript_56482:62-1036(+)
MPQRNEEAIVPLDSQENRHQPGHAANGTSLQQAADVMLRAIKEAQCCENLLRSHAVSLEAELEAAREDARAQQRITEEVRAENQQLKAKLESFGELIAKQQQTIQDHEARLRNFSKSTFRTMASRKFAGDKRRRLTDSPSPKEEPMEDGTTGSTTKKPENKTEPGEQIVTKAVSPSLPAARNGEKNVLKPTSSAPAEASSLANLKIAGLRVWEPAKEPRDLAKCFVPDQGKGELAIRSRSFDGEVVKEGPPCRCVVRGKQRLALKGYDCEQCRNFFAVTKGPKTGQSCNSSRHRMDHAPTCTPPGFWDLSFPLGSQVQPMPLQN